MDWSSASGTPHTPFAGSVASSNPSSLASAFGEPAEGPAIARAPSPVAPGTGRGAATQLLLFVGDAVRPDPALVALLAREGLRCLSLPGAEQAVRAAALARFDALLVDAALVEGRAARALEALAAAHGCPVLVLAERADEVDEIVALELGADLYLARPLAPRRLRAHLQALLRRRAPGRDMRDDAGPAAALDSRAESRPGTGAAAHAPRGLQAGGWTLDWAQLHLRRETRQVRLTQAQAALLRCLMAAAGDIVPADTLLTALPRPDRLQERLHARGLRVHVHRLRQKLRDEGVTELQIEAVRGSGYVLAADTR